MQIKVHRMFNGTVVDISTHDVSTLIGLRRVLYACPRGSGWGVFVEMPWVLAEHIGIYETADGTLRLFGSSERVELCAGRLT